MTGASAAAARLGVAFVAAAALAGCAYFNTFYSAKKNFAEAERQVMTQPDPEVPAAAGAAGLYDKAIQGATKVILDYPKSKWVDDAVLLIGRSQLGRGDYDDAQEKFAELAKNFPGSDLLDQALYYSAVAADRDRRRPEAMALYDSLLAAYPKSKMRDDAMYRRANLYLALREPDRALGDLKELSTRGGKMGYDAGLKLAEALFAQKNFADARTEFIRVAERAPTEKLRTDARLRAGDCDEAAGNYAGAAQSYLVLLQEAKTDDAKARARLRYGNALALSGQVERGMRELSNVVQDYPRTAYAAEAMFRTGYLDEVVRDDFKAAAAAYDKVGEQSPGSPFVAQARTRKDNLSRLAGSQSDTADSSSADRAAEQAYRQAEYYLFQLARPDKAEEGLAKLVVEHPDSRLAPKATFARAWVLARRLGRVEEARALVDTLAHRWPDSEYTAAAKRLAANPADSTAVLESLPLTTIQMQLVPGNPVYTPPPPVPTQRAKPGQPASATLAGAKPVGMTKADSLAAIARFDSLKARADSIRAAQKAAPAAGTAPADTTKPKLEK